MAVAGDGDFTLARTGEAADQIQQRGLAGTGRPHQRDKITLRDFQIEAVQYFDGLLAARVALGDVLQRNDIAHVCSPRCCVMRVWNLVSPARAGMTVQGNAAQRSEEHTSELQ